MYSLLIHKSDIFVSYFNNIISNIYIFPSDKLETENIFVSIFCLINDLNDYQNEFSVN